MMDAHIQFAPIATLERLNDPAWNRADTTLYDAGSLAFRPSKTEVPLLIDHDENRQVGLVRTLYRIEEPDGPWLCAAARVTAPPGWLTRGTQASFAFLPIQESSFTQPGDADHIRKGWITEVSILSPGTKPAEPRAKVTLFQPAEQPKPAKPAAASTPTLVSSVMRRDRATERAAAEYAEFNRRLDWLESHTGRPADTEAVIVGMQRELNGPSLDDLAREHGVSGRRVVDGGAIIRRHIGQVLGVR